MIEGEVLHVAVNRKQLAGGENRQSNVQNTVLGLRVLHDQEETEVAGVSRPPHGLHHLLLALVEHAAAVRHDDQQLADGQVPGGAGDGLHEELGGEVQQGDEAGLLLLEMELVLKGYYIDANVATGRRLLRVVFTLK